MKLDWILITAALTALLLLPLLAVSLSKKVSASRGGSVSGEWTYVLLLNRASMLLFWTGMLHSMVYLTTGRLAAPFDVTGVAMAAMGGFIYLLTWPKSSR